MKKKILFAAMLLTSVLALGQQTNDSTAVVVYNFGDSALEFLKQNAWTLVFALFYLLSEWIGESDKFPEGSLWRKVLNFIFELARKKATLSAKMKKVNAIYEKELKAAKPNIDLNKGFKVIAIGVLISAFAFTASAQSPAGGFLKPSKANPLVKEMVKTSESDLLKAGEPTGVWLLRPAVGVVATQFTYNKDLKQLESAAFTKVGLGIGYQKFTEVNGEAYNSFGVNALLFFGASQDLSKLDFTTALTVHTLKLVDIGIAYDFGLKQPMLLTGVTYSF